MSIEERIERGRIVPVIAIEEARDIVPLCKALREGGLTVAEITFRTAAAREAIRIAAAEFPNFALGAGTVTTIDELEAAQGSGAEFAVAPGCNPDIANHAFETGLPFYPGVCTPSDIERAVACGCRTLKFFPAEAAGGVKLLKAMSGPYKHKGLRYIPTGGIKASNAAEYLALGNVLAVGGSWIVDKKLLTDRRWDEVTRLTREALESLGA